MTYSKEKSRYTFLTNVPRTRTVEDQNVEHVMIQYCVLGWSDFFLVWQKTALNQRSGMILEVQILELWLSAAFCLIKKNKNHSTLVYMH